jgi:hypothetical protein
MTRREAVPRQNSGGTELHPFNNVTGLARKLLISKSVIILARDRHNDVLPMFLSLNTVLGVFLLLAVKQPVKHRSLIAYGAWSSLAHGFTMTIQSAEAAARGMHRNDSPLDIVIFAVIGVALLALLPAKEPSPAGAPISEPRFAER